MAFRVESEFPSSFPGGDVQLKVTHGGRIFTTKVCADSMASACKVWKNFVYPPWADYAAVDATLTPPTTRTTSDTQTKVPSDGSRAPANHECRKIPVKELDFTEDDSEALLILLNIAHGRVDGVSSVVPYKTLVNIAVLCDQYDCVKMTKPWAGEWLEGEDFVSLEPGKEQWLFISWVFGREKVFEELAFQLIRTIRIDDEGYCRNEQNRHFSEPLPAGIIEPIVGIRKEVIRQLLAPLYQDLEKYDCRKNVICRRGKTEESKLACDAAIHESLKTSLKWAGLLPMKSHKEIQYTVNELCSRLRGIIIERSDPTHMCGPPYKYSSHIRRTMIAIPSPVKRFHLEHMRRQREVLGEIHVQRVWVHGVDERMAHKPVTGFENSRDLQIA